MTQNDIPNPPPKRSPPDKTILGAVATIGAYALAGPIAYGLKMHFYGTSAKTFGGKVARFMGASLLCEAFWISATVYEYSNIMDNQVKPQSRQLIESTPCVPNRTLYGRTGTIECEPRPLGVALSPIFRFKAGPYVIHESRHYQESSYPANMKCSTSIVTIAGTNDRDKSFVNWYQIPLTCRTGLDSPMAE